MKKNDTDNKHW